MTELLITAALHGCLVRLWSKNEAGDGPRPANWCRHGRSVLVNHSCQSVIICVSSQCHCVSVVCLVWTRKQKASVLLLHSLMKDYFFKPPINKISLNFLETPLEKAYRSSYQEEVATLTLPAPRASSSGDPTSGEPPAVLPLSLHSNLGKKGGGGMEGKLSLF